MMNKLLRQYITFENIIIGFGIQPDCVKGMFEMLKNDTECVELDMNGMENKLSFCCMLTKDLIENVMEVQGTKLISEMLMVNTTLKTLNLSCLKTIKRAMNTLA